MVDIEIRGDRIDAAGIGIAACSDTGIALASRPAILLDQCGRNIFREDAVRGLANRWLHHHPARRTCRAVDQIDGLLAIVDAGLFIAAREGEFEARRWLPGRFQFGAFHGGVEIQVDRGAIHDLRDLIALVIVEEDIAVECQRTVQRAVLGAEFEGVDIFRFESERVHREIDVDRGHACI